MENTTNTNNGTENAVVLTPIVAVRVNDFEFEPKDARGRNTPTNARVSIKIQNSVQELRLFLKTDYETKMTEVGTSFDESKYSSPAPIVSTLKDLGFVVFLENIKKEYYEKAMVIKEAEEQEKRKALELEYDNCWAVRNLEAVKTYCFKSEVSISKERYMEGGHYGYPTIQSEYLGKTFTVSHSSKTGRIEARSFWSTKIEKVMPKVLGAIKEQIENEKSKKEYEEKKKALEGDIISNIKFPTTKEQEYHNSDGRRGKGYTTDYFKVVIGEDYYDRLKVTESKDGDNIYLRVSGIPGRYTFDQFNNELVPFLQKFLVKKSS